MFRPDRIGLRTSPIVDLDLARLAWPTEWNTNLDAVDVARGSPPGPHFRSATVRDDFDQLSVIGEGSVSFASDQHFSLGVAINGEDLNELGVRYSGHISAYASLDSASLEVGVAGWIGRLDSSAVDVARGAVNNAVSNPIYLPGHNAGPSHINIGYSWEGTVLAVDQDEDGFGSNPVVLGVSLYNNDSAATSLAHLAISMSLFRWKSDLQVFDPNR